MLLLGVKFYKCQIGHVGSSVVQIYTLVDFFLPFFLTFFLSFESQLGIYQHPTA